MSAAGGTTETAATSGPGAEGEEAAPEIVSAFPLPPAFFALYRDGPAVGPPPPEPMAPQYHMFGTPFSTEDAVPDLLPVPGQKLYLPTTTKADAAAAMTTTTTTTTAGPNAGDGGAAGGTTATTTAPTTAASAAASASTAGGAGNTPTEAGAMASSSPATDGDKATEAPTAAASPAIDYKAQLKRLNHSLLANFLELVDVLIQSPSMFNDKLSDIELLFLNMHNLINAFRPHQARETIIHMLQTQIQERRDAAHEIRRTIDEARRAVEDKHSQLQESAEEAAVVSTAVQDLDVKMEDAPAAATAPASALEAAASGGGALGTTTGSSTSTTTTTSVSGTTVSSAAAAALQQPLTLRAREVQQRQETFFAALEGAMSS